MKTSRFLLSIVVVCTISLTTLQAQDSLTVDYLATIGISWANPIDVDVSDNLVFVATGRSGLRIIDNSVPVYPHETGFIDLSGDEVLVSIDGDYCFLLDRETGIYILDVTSPENVTEVNCLQMNEEEVADAFTIFGDYLFLCYSTADASFLSAVDISDPANPDLVGNLEIPSSAVKMAFNADNIYVICSDNRLIMLNISDPEHISQAGSYDFEEMAAIDFVVNQDYAFVTSNAGLIVVDLRNPEELSQAAFLETDSVSTVSIRGDYAFLTSAEHLILVDIEDPESPSVSLEIEAVLENVRESHIEEDIWYLVGPSNGLVTMDITVPAEMTEINRYHPQHRCGHLAVSGNYAYVNGGIPGDEYIDHLIVIDVSYPEMPFVAGWCGVDESISGLAVEGDIVVASWMRAAGGLITFDVSDPADPQMLSIIGVGGCWSEDVFISGNTAYVGVNVEGLTAVDITDPEDPVVLDNPESAPKYFEGAAIYGDYAYIGGFAEHDGDLQILDISDPADITEIASFESLGWASSMVIQDQYLYATAYDRGMSILDISNPVEPWLVGTFEGVFGKVSVSGDYAVVKNYEGGFHLLDISNPEDVSLISTTETIASTNEPVIVGNNIYLANHFFFHTYEINEVEITAPEQGVRLPEEFTVGSFYPNPFNSESGVNFRLSVPGNVRFQVYSTLGRLLHDTDSRFSAGTHQFRFSPAYFGKTTGSGTYFVAIQHNDQIQIRNLILVK
ncbi:MAG: T9SS type A sorting domain-containing protein [Candidatus Hatepunaea meridiana]|nr:T9SS type A sorting domain-containing protein [Candidatus Hatepunaea meridiana]